MRVVILPDAASIARFGADIFVQQIQQKSASVLSFATGSSPLALYQQLINDCQHKKISFKV